MPTPPQQGRGPQEQAGATRTAVGSSRARRRRVARTKMAQARMAQARMVRHLPESQAWPQAQREHPEAPEPRETAATRDARQRRRRGPQRLPGGAPLFRVAQQRAAPLGRPRGAVDYRASARCRASARADLPVGRHPTAPVWTRTSAALRSRRSWGSTPPRARESHRRSRARRQQYLRRHRWEPPTAKEHLRSVGSPTRRWRRWRAPPWTRAR